MNSQPPQQPGDGDKKVGGGPKKTTGEIGTDGKTISSLFMLRPPDRYHSADNNGTLACIRKLRLVEQREEDAAQQKGDAEHPINLD